MVQTGDPTGKIQFCVWEVKKLFCTIKNGFNNFICTNKRLHAPALKVFSKHDHAMDN